MIRLLRRLVAASLAVYLLGMGLSVTPALTVPACADALPRGAVAVVLGAGTESNGTADRSSAGRTGAALALWQAGAVQRLHFTGSAQATRPTAEAMAELARAAGVPAARITTETLSRSTLQNAMMSRAAIEDADGIVLISSGFHLWRARASFAWAGVPVTAMCRGARFDLNPPLSGSLHVLALEGVKWPANVLRAGAWSLGGVFGLRESLPGWLLAGPPARPAGLG